MVTKKLSQFSMVPRLNHHIDSRLHRLHVQRMNHIDMTTKNHAKCWHVVLCNISNEGAIPLEDGATADHPHLKTSAKTLLQAHGELANLGSCGIARQDHVQGLSG